MIHNIYILCIIIYIYILCNIYMVYVDTDILNNWNCTPRESGDHSVSAI